MPVSDRLRWAIKHDKLAIVRRLVQRYPQMLENVDPANGWSSLHYAGYHGHYHICVFLVQQGHDKDEISLAHDRSTALHLAASQNHEQTVHFLAQHIPRCLNWVNMDHETALMVAARYGHDPSINLLLDFGADIDTPNKDSNRPIHVAAAYGHIKTLRTLVERNADVQTPNAEGFRPVQYCSTYQVQDYLQSLIHEKSEADKRRRHNNAANGTPNSVMSNVSLASAANLRASPSRDVFHVGGVIAAAAAVSTPSSSENLAHQGPSQFHLPSFNIATRQPSSNSSSNSSLPGSTASIPILSSTTSPAAAMTAMHPVGSSPPSPSPRRKPVRELALNLDLDKPLPSIDAMDPPRTPVNQMPPVIPPRKGSLGQLSRPMPKFSFPKTSSSASPSSSSASVASASPYGTPKKTKILDMRVSSTPRTSKDFQ